MKTVFRDNYTIDTTYTAEDFINDFSLLKERLFRVYKFISSRNFAYMNMQREIEEVTASKTFKSLPTTHKLYIARFYKLALKRLARKYTVAETAEALRIDSTENLIKKGEKAK